jgi:hypothetical protein
MNFEELVKMFEAQGFEDARGMAAYMMATQGDQNNESQTDFGSAIIGGNLVPTTGDDVDAANANNAGLLTPTLGVSQTDMSQVDAGALTSLPAYQQATALANQVYGEREPISPAMLSFLFFSKMAEESSKPGATALGAAGTAAATPAAYLMKERELDAADKKAKATLAATLTTTLSKAPPTSKLYVDPNDSTKTIRLTEAEIAARSDGDSLIPYKAPTTGTLKSVGTGNLAQYMSAEDARKFVIQQGMSEDHPNFDANVAKFIAPSPNLIGESILSGGLFSEAVPLVKDGEVINLQITPSKAAAKPFWTTYTEKRLPLIAKSQDGFNAKATSTIPRVDQALEVLLSGEVETGAVAEFTLPFRKFLIGLYGTEDPSIIGQESLQSISNIIATQMRPPGSGSTSDMEFKAYQRAGLDLGNTPQANYISLYAFKKMTENAISLNNAEFELLTGGQVRSGKQLREELNKIDTGIFEKYTGDVDDNDAIQAWYDSLPDGAVMINNGIIESDMPYIIKGWRGTQ